LFLEGMDADILRIKKILDTVYGYKRVNPKHLSWVMGMIFGLRIQIVTTVECGIIL
jgi:hypothetical protein